ncbi:hypothetical protein C5167_050957 [Papaver somniferum]|uniref:Mechanosensitive ion channel MscS domain-containing protein n=1 Tax=Papaver somniferum TaxID=3469 RepID=A0A4Y7KRK2_PAPSO|nr:uncharacterized protein LOC113303844 [Papaver somniferum]RZC75476.1 hypothetical protein C5167_050957 [Papaver somniferum]
MACVMTRAKAITSFENYQILKTSRKPHYPPTQISFHKQPVGLGNTRLTLKKKKMRHFVSCCCLKAEFPSTTWWKEKSAGIALEIAKALILWIAGRLYKKCVFITSPPFAKDDLIQLKVNGDLISGAVEKIGYTKTYIRGVDGYMNSVPNAEVDSKNIKHLTLVTKVSNVKADAEKAPKKEGDGILDGQGDAGEDSKKDVDTEFKLWGVTLSVQIGFESCEKMNKRIKAIGDFITSNDHVKERKHITVFFEAFLPDKKAFKVSVSFFVDAHENMNNYSDIQGYFQMKLEELATLTVNEIN